MEPMELCVMTTGITLMPPWSAHNWSSLNMVSLKDDTKNSTCCHSMHVKILGRFINPRRTCARVTVVGSACLCVCVSVCVSLCLLLNISLFQCSFVSQTIRLT